MEALSVNSDYLYALSTYYFNCQCMCSLTDYFQKKICLPLLVIDCVVHVSQSLKQHAEDRTKTGS